ncbi:hypothetical protein BURKHO8Y_170113 [Burkholderia sp. 8Y]|nr:hypothetical protein BURKHO8Y_170113 [Burkholderia sp. 8Y]
MAKATLRDMRRNTGKRGELLRSTIEEARMIVAALSGRAKARELDTACAAEDSVPKRLITVAAGNVLESGCGGRI